MTKQEIQNYLYENIPVTKSLGVEAVAFSKDEVKFKAPLAANINHRSTAFGGSISSLLITTGWSYLRLLFDDSNPVPRIVIGKSSTEYLEPVITDFTSEIIIPQKETLERFWEMYHRFGKARIKLQAKIEREGIVQATFEGEFAVFGKEEVKE